MKFGIPFLKDHASIKKMNFLKNIRFHNFYIEMASKPTGVSGYWHNINANVIQNVEFSNIESNKALHGHIQVNNSREVIFFKNNLYGNFGYDHSGGYQYGIKINWCTRCYIINNRSSDLRHNYATQFGCNHCVIAYNRAEPPYNHYADFGQHNSKGCHNNLFEGNYGSEIYDDANPKRSWGTRYTMWFRNHAISKVGSENAYVEHMTIIGNELEGGASGIKKGAPGEDTFSGANIVNVSNEGEGGTMVWGDMKEGAAIPASLFLTHKPSYLSKWPLYGPLASDDTESVLDFANLSNNDEINKGSDLLVEAKTTVEFAEISLWVNGSLVATLTEAPYQWSSYPEIMDMMELTYNLKLVGKLINGEFIEKEITVQTPEQWAYTSDLLPHPIPGVLQAEAYDYGGENIAYFDKTEQQSPEFSYRGDDKTDLSSDGLWLNLVSGGEWLEYTIDVQRSGSYALAVKHKTRRSPEFEAMSFFLQDSDTALFANLVCTYTGGDTSTIDTFNTVYLNKRKQIVRLEIETDGWDMDYFEFILTSKTIDYENQGTRSNPNNPDSYDAGATIHYLEAPLDSLGFDFAGWFTNEAFTDTVPVPAIAEGDDGSKVFYAKWTPQLLVGSATIYGDIIEGQTLHIDTSLIENNSGKFIYQWQKQAAGGDFIDVSGAVNKSYTIQTNDVGSRLRVKISSTVQTGELISKSTNTILSVTDKYFTITYNSNGGFDGVTTQELVGAGGFPTFVAHPNKVGYIISHWVNEQGDTLNSVSPINSDTTLYARWNARIRYSVYFEMDDKTTEIHSNSFPAYLSHLPDAPLKVDSVLSYWITEQGEPFDTTFLLEKDIHVYPVWKVKRFALHIASDHGGIIYEPKQETYEIYSEVTLTAVPSSEYEFVNWTGDYESTDTTITVVMDSAINLMANYRQRPFYRLDVYFSKGEVSKFPNSSRFLSGSAVTLTATPANGYEFESWSGDYVGDENPLYLTMTEDMEILANFVLDITAIESIETSGISLFPNPNNGVFTIQLNGNLSAEYTLCNIAGVKVLSGIVDAQQKVEVKDSKPGVYLLEVNTKQECKVLKVVVK